MKRFGEKNLQQKPVTNETLLTGDTLADHPLILADHPLILEDTNGEVIKRAAIQTKVWSNK